MLATVTGTLYRNCGPDATPVPHSRGRVTAEPLLLDESVEIVHSRSLVQAVADAAGLVALHLWPGAWRITLPDGEVIDGPDHTGVVVEAGGVYTLEALRGYVPGPGVSVQVIEVPATLAADVASALGSKAAAAQSASDAAGSASDAASSAADALTAQHAVEEARDAAQGSASTASGAAATAAGAQDAVALSASDAAASALAAAGSASDAAGSASAASGSATAASGSATSASGSASSASSSASDASGSATAAQTAQGLAESARDAAVTAKGAAESAQTSAAGSASAASGSASAASGSASAASGSASAASTSATNAATSASAAASSASSATTKAGEAATSAANAATSASNAAATLANAALKTTVDAKGDLLAGTANDTLSRLAVGPNGALLMGNSNATTGLAYQSPIPLITNLVTNGDFSGGMTGWSGTTNAGFAVAAGAGSITVTASGESAGQSLSLTAGRRYYIAATLTVATTGTTAVTFGFSSGADAPLATVAATSAQTLSAVQVATATGTSTLRVVDGRASAWTKVSFDNVACIDITACFGAGNEPSKPEMDAIMATWGGWLADTDPKLLPTYGWGKLTQNAARNLVTNGDFSNGTAGWSSAAASSLSANPPVVTVTGDGSNATVSAFMATATTVVMGHKWYGAAMLRVTNAAATQLRLRLIAGYLDITQASPTSGSWYSLSGVATAGSSITATSLSVSHIYADAATASGKVMEVKYPITFNLTTLFGAGNEPTATEMDFLLSKYPSSWFNGTVNDLKSDYDPMRRIGTGSPYNTITPRKVGETWTDVAQTCGARVWTSTGTTTTSWVVTDGDTGSRVLTSWDTAGTVTGDALPSGVAPTAGTAGSVKVRRRGPQVVYAIRGATWTAASTFTVPVGFRSLTAQYRPTTVIVSGSPAPSTATVGTSTLTLGASGQSAHATNATVVTFEADTWATTSPGTPG